MYAPIDPINPINPINPIDPAPSTKNLAQKLKQEYNEFKHTFSTIITPNTNEEDAPAAKQTPKPEYTRVSEMIERILLAIKPFFPTLQQPKFVVTDCAVNEQMTMWYCVPTSMEIPQSLLFQQSASQKLSDRQQRFWHRMSSFVDAEWYVVPILYIWLRQKGYKVKCCAVESQVLELLPVLRMQTSTYKKNGQEFANTKDVLMSGFVEKTSGNRCSLSVQFRVGRSKPPAVDFAAVYACEGKEDEWSRVCNATKTRFPFVPNTTKKTTDNVDADFQLFLLYRTLQLQSPGIAKEFMDTVGRTIQSTSTTPTITSTIAV